MKRIEGAGAGHLFESVLRSTTSVDFTKGFPLGNEKGSILRRLFVYSLVSILLLSGCVPPAGREIMNASGCQ